MTQEKLKLMTRNEKVDFIIDYYNEHFKWQKFVYDQYIDRSKVEALTDDQLDDFILKNCK